MTEPEDNKPDGWAEAWPDVLACAIGLAMAWQFRWDSGDLIWSLWLSSLLVGYAIIVWSIFGLGMFIATKAVGDRAMIVPDARGPIAVGGAVYLIGGLFMLAFFTVHFGGFHYGHSVFLQIFFPVTPEAGQKPFSGFALYAEIFRRYWWFVPLAAVAERRAFRFAPAEPTGPPDTAVTVEAIAARKAKNARAGFGSTGLMAPYRNVVRMHLLIFFFAFAHFAKLENFWIYAVVYAVYFFPWRLLKKQEAISNKP